MLSNRSKRGFTLIELLIVIAIILILIAIALPNFLEAQNRAKLVRERSDMKTIATAIESMRAQRNGVLLVDFWDDDSTPIRLARLGVGSCERGNVSVLTKEAVTFFACCCWHSGDHRGGTTGLFTPLTTPIRYLGEVPPDPFGFEDGDQALIPEDVYPPISYMYHDREDADFRLSNDDFKGVPYPYRPGDSAEILPLRQDHYILVGFGPDQQRTHGNVYPYAPTNGSKSFGDVVYRSDEGY